MIEDVRAALLGDHEAAKRLAEAERYAARLETMCKGQDKQLMEVQEGARELQLAMDGVLMAAELEHGEAVKNDQTGEIVGWRRILSRAGDWPGGGYCYQPRPGCHPDAPHQPPAHHPLPG